MIVLSFNYISLGNIIVVDRIGSRLLFNFDIFRRLSYIDLSGLGFAIYAT